MWISISFDIDEDGDNNNWFIQLKVNRFCYELYAHFDKLMAKRIDLEFVTEQKRRKKTQQQNKSKEERKDWMRHKTSMIINFIVTVIYWPQCTYKRFAFLSLLVLGLWPKRN